VDDGVVARLGDGQLQPLDGVGRLRVHAERVA